MIKLKNLFLFIFLFFSSISCIAALFGKKDFNLLQLTELIANEEYLFPFLEKEFKHLLEKRIKELNLELDKPYSQDILKIIYEEELTLIFSSILDNPEIFYEFYKKVDSDFKKKLFKKLENEDEASLRGKEILEKIFLDEKETFLPEKDISKLIFLNKEDCLKNEGFSIQNETCLFNFLYKKGKKRKVNMEICKDYGYFWNSNQLACEYRFPKKFFISHSFSEDHKCEFNHLPWIKGIKYILIKEKENFFCIKQTNLSNEYFKNYKQIDGFYIKEKKNANTKKMILIKINHSTFDLEYQFILLYQQITDFKLVLRGDFLYFDFSVPSPRIFFKINKHKSNFLHNSNEFSEFYMNINIEDDKKYLVDNHKKILNIYYWGSLPFLYH